MPTLGHLLANGTLMRLDPLPSKPSREMYALKEFRHDLERLPGPGDSWRKTDGRVPPRDQAIILIKKFQMGHRLNVDPMWDEVKTLKPIRNGVWEFRTVSVRLFGWFVARDQFIAHRAMLKDEIAGKGTTSGLANATAWERDFSLGFKPGEFITTGKVTDVLSNQV